MLTIIINIGEPMEEIKQNLLRKQVENEKESARDLIKNRKYMEACTHFMSLSSIFRKAAYLYPPELAENLFSLASDYESIAINIRNRERAANLQKLIDIKGNDLANCLFFPEKPPETWDHIGGLENAKIALRELRGNRAFLLYGPEGTGKKTLVRAFANNRKIDFFEIFASDLISKYFGDSRQLIDALFEKAMKSRGSVIFINGIDTFTQEKTSFTETKGVLLYLMARIEEIQRHREMDMYVFASASRPWKMDKDIQEHFPVKINTTLPDAASRALIFKIHLTGSDSSGVNMEGLVNKTEGFTGKDVSGICYKVLEKMLLEQNPGIEQLNVRTLQQAIVQRPLKDDDFTKPLEEAQPEAYPADEYRLWKNEFGG